MQLREWIMVSGYSIKRFSEAVNVERAMIYRYYGGAIPRASMLLRIDLITGGMVTAQDFYENAKLYLTLDQAEYSPPVAMAQRSPHRLSGTIDGLTDPIGDTP